MKEEDREGGRKRRRRKGKEGKETKPANLPEQISRNDVSISIHENETPFLHCMSASRVVSMSVRAREGGEAERK